MAISKCKYLSRVEETITQDKVGTKAVAIKEDKVAKVAKVITKMTMTIFLTEKFNRLYIFIKSIIA